MSKLADDLERLCCAETEGKFFDYVADNIPEIISALRLAATPKAGVGREAVAWRVKNDFGHWYITQDKAMAGTYRDIEKLNVEPLYTDALPPDNAGLVSGGGK